MMMRKGYQPLLMEMDERAQLIAANALHAQNGQDRAPDRQAGGLPDRGELHRGQGYLVDDRLLEAGIDQMSQAAPLALPSIKQRLIQHEEVI
ncbi:hypothetical protein [Pseudomonas aeruginosa]|uniref:hypothetical protein n=1 Tax=Pseudomonas aeruginosa TaxID=287 RepID=UPI001AD9AD65|nr:hypothetical protein [Pseudomonas aeruginosa]